MLKDRVILVTGATSGIGFATAKLCREYGARVVIHGRNPQKMQASAQKLGSDVKFVIADLRDTAAPQKLIDFVTGEYGRIDGIVNNAAMLDRCTIENTTDDLFADIMAVNARAPVMLIKAALPFMENQKTGGSIVNIGSINAHCGASKILLYSISKGALMTATRNLGDALSARHVRVNQLNVGWTETENEHLVQEKEGQPKDWLDHIPEAAAPSGKLLAPETIAEHAAFWLSDKSGPVTGQVVDVEQYPLIGRLKYI